MIKDRLLLNQIKSIHQSSREIYGYLRITAELNSRGVVINHKKVYRLMKANNIYGKYKRKFRATVKPIDSSLIAHNLLKQNFIMSSANKAWVSDISYIWTNEGWLYLAIILDLYSRKIVGWSLSERMTKDLVTNAFLKAYWSRKPQKGLIHHSDRGSQYCSKQFQQILETLGVMTSMSDKGNCYDNAVAESFFHTLKNELPNSCIFKTREEARSKIFEYIEAFYNSRRRHSFLGYCSPNEFELISQKKVA
jgi:putative transposase